MIDLNFIKSFFPATIANNTHFERYILKEYLQLIILDHLANTPYISKIAFIGGTNLRLIQGIDRFSEDLDFDCKQMGEKDFNDMTDSVIHYLKLNNIRVEPRDKPNPKLSAYRRNLHFPEMLFDLGITGHREERLLIKIEMQDQGVDYTTDVATVNKMGFFFNLSVPPLNVLCAMKLSAVLARHKGRDFYDSLFLLSKTQPDYHFLASKHGIKNLQELKAAMALLQKNVDMHQKQRDFQHLLFNEKNSERILHFFNYFEKM